MDRSKTYLIIISTNLQETLSWVSSGDLSATRAKISLKNVHKFKSTLIFDARVAERSPEDTRDRVS